MPKLGKRVQRSALRAFLVLGALPAITLAADLSKYRDFQLGSDLSAIARQTGVSPSQAKAIHLRPALIQELEWRPQSLGSSSRAEAAQQVVFSFYKGELFQIAVNYDRYETEGLTVDDFIDAMSPIYGIAERSALTPTPVEATYDDREERVARWQDSQYTFDLIRSSYGPTFRLVGILRRLQAPVQSAITEAKRLDDIEAPQREAARLAGEKETNQARLDKSRTTNKAKFRP